jgi:hypothetical protein
MQRGPDHWGAEYHGTLERIKKGPFAEPLAAATDDNPQMETRYPKAFGVSVSLLLHYGLFAGAVRLKVAELT